MDREREGGPHTQADAAQSIPRLPRPHTTRQVVAKSRCYDPLCTQLCCVEAGLAKGPSEPG